MELSTDGTLANRWLRDSSLSREAWIGLLKNMGIASNELNARINWETRAPSLELLEFTAKYFALKAIAEKGPEMIRNGWEPDYEEAGEGFIMHTLEARKLISEYISRELRQIRGLA